MKRIILAALVGVLVGMAAPVAGQGVEDASLAATSVVEVRLKDKVRDGCLPNPKAIKNAVELKLIANGI